MYFICIFSYFLCISTKKYETNTKNTKKYESQKYKIYKKNTNQQFQKYKIQKKNTNPKFQKYKIYKEKTNSKISQRANPVFTVEIRKQIAKKMQNQPLGGYFPNPAVLIMYFWVVFFSHFFLYFEMLAEDPSVATADNSNLSIYLSIYLQDQKRRDSARLP